MKVSEGSLAKVMTMNEEVIDVVVVNGARLEAVEIFRACGIKWTRYKLKNESRYATELEWAQWKSGTPEEL